VSFRASDLWRWGGTIDRGPFALIGTALALLKYGIDAVIVRIFAGRTWTPLNYWLGGDTFGDLLTNPAMSAARWALLAVSLPFLTLGAAMTVRRLRSADLPTWLVVTFFVPGLNFLFFVTLMLLPPRRPDPQAPANAVLGRLIPRSRFGSAVAGMLLTLVPATLLILLGAQVLKTYGWGLFLGTPFLIGFFSTLVYEYHQPRALKDSLGVTLASLGLLSASLLLFAIEGILCILMVAPLAIPIAFFGSWMAHEIRPHAAHGMSRNLLGLLLAVTLLMGMEKEFEPEPPLRSVTTAIDVQAPPAAVWAQVVSFSEIPPPEELIFKSGLAYPLRAEIQGRGVGAVRHCVFTTGPFVEPITAWDEPSLLAFGVTAQPAPMEEWTPYSGIHPPHLDGYFLSQKGQFRLTRLPGGGTRLEGTTWYTHRLWPTAYWGLWSDAVLHRIHGRVLQHVKRLAEEKGA
jgi:hypothetical protein